MTPSTTFLALLGALVCTTSVAWGWAPASQFPQTEAPLATPSVRPMLANPVGDLENWEAELSLEQRVDRVRYQVAPGDTLGGIAARYGVSVADLRRWNNLRGDIIQIGQTLTIQTRGRGGSRTGAGDRVQDSYVVRSGDTGGAIARRHRASLQELQRWNRGVDLDRLRIGQRLVVYVEGASTGGSGSTGSPNNGRLRGGVLLPDGLGYRIRDRSRSYGTPATVNHLRNGLARVSARFVEVPDVIVHDLSTERGGRLGGHLSHQNGLDADVSYYRVDAPEFANWQTVTAEELDVRLQWYLFRTWLDLGVVEYLFVDYELQRPLYEYAQARGATEEQLAEWFEYPRRGSQGIIRHSGGHDDHFHVRFLPDR